MGKYRETTFKKYLAEALSKDFTNSKTMFDQAVKNFKEVKEVNATSLNLLSDILRYISKFIEEQNVVSPLPELKKAKESTREAMNQLDKAYEKMASEDLSLPKKSKATKFDDDMPDDMFNSDDTTDTSDMTPDDTDTGDDDLNTDTDTMSLTDTGDDSDNTDIASDSDKLPPMDNDDDIRA